MSLAPGATGTASLTVTPDDTATAVGSGDVPVFATPRVLALAEAATVDALRGHLPDGQTTVGVRVDLTHSAATPVGATATAEATLIEVDGRTLRFSVLVRDDVVRDDVVRDDTGGGRVVAEATIERAAIDRARFLAKLPAAQDPR